MASAEEVQSLKQRSESAVAVPLPVFTIPPLPEKIARIDPAGAATWHQSANAAVRDWIKKQNTMSGNIAAAIPAS